MIIGETISHYRVVELLGAGGMGEVFKAEDTRLKRAVALKFLPLNLTQDRDAKQRLLHEAQAASALDHPTICTIYEIKETPEGRLFVAMAAVPDGRHFPHEGGTILRSFEQGEMSYLGFLVKSGRALLLPMSLSSASPPSAAPTRRDVRGEARATAPGWRGRRRQACGGSCGLDVNSLPP